MNYGNRIILQFFFSPKSELTEENLKWLENVFRRSVGESGEIRLADFKKIVNSKNVRNYVTIAPLNITLNV